jgi:hypothetical protein
MMTEEEMLRYDLQGYIQRLGMPEVIKAVQEALKLSEELREKQLIEAIEPYRKRLEKEG